MIIWLAVFAICLALIAAANVFAAGSSWVIQASKLGLGIALIYAAFEAVNGLGAVALLLGAIAGAEVIRLIRRGRKAA